MDAEVNTKHLLVDVRVFQDVFHHLDSSRSMLMIALSETRHRSRRRHLRKTERFDFLDGLEQIQDRLDEIVMLGQHDVPLDESRDRGIEPAHVRLVEQRDERSDQFFGMVQVTRRIVLDLLSQGGQVGQVRLAHIGFRERILLAHFCSFIEGCFKLADFENRST
jgi:hypothetical protein